jgi:hypothetical protein
MYYYYYRWRAARRHIRTRPGTRPKEIQALLKFGRDSAWPLKITEASALDETTSLSITYDSDWEECDETMD